MADKDPSTPQETPEDPASEDALFDALEAEIGEWVNDEDIEELGEIEKEFGAAMAEMTREFTKANIDDAQERAKSWVAEHPVLTVALAVGAGVVLGHALSRARRPAPLSKRVRRQGKKLASQSSKLARDLGEDVAERAALAGSVLAAKAARAKAETRGVASSLRNAIEAGTSEVSHYVHAQRDRVGENAEDVLDAATSRAIDAWHAVQDVAEDASEAVEDMAKQGFGFVEQLMRVLKTVFTAVALKKITEWFRKIG